MSKNTFKHTSYTSLFLSTSLVCSSIQAMEAEQAQQTNKRTFDEARLSETTELTEPSKKSRREDQILAHVTEGKEALAKMDFEQALVLFSDAADDNNAEAQYYLGMMHHKGHGTLKNLTIAFQFYHKAVPQDQPDAQIALGTMYDKNINPEENLNFLTANFDMAEKLYMSPALKGFTEAEYLLGRLYAHRDAPTTTDLDKAAEWLTKAAHKDNADAQFELGLLYSNARNDFSIYWLTKAANKDHTEAQYLLGDLYGRKQMGDHAIKWLTKAALKNHANAQIALAGCLFSSYPGIAPNYDWGIKWLLEYIKSPHHDRDLFNNIFYIVRPQNQDKRNTKMLTHETHEEIKALMKSSEKALTLIDQVEKDMPLFSLHFKKLHDYTATIQNLLNHLNDEEAMSKGFLITDLQIQINHQEYRQITEQLEGDTSTYVHGIFAPDARYLSFETPENLKYARIVRDLRNEESAPNQEIKIIFKNLSNLVIEQRNHDILENMKCRSEILNAQASSLSAEQLRSEFETRNARIEKIDILLKAFDKIDRLKTKVLALLIKSAPVRNEAVKANDSFRLLR